MNTLEPKPGKWRRMRWAWLALSVLGVLTTPGAILHAMDLYKADHKFSFMIFIAFAIRFGEIWVFAWLWWKYRPSAPQTSQ